MNIIYLAYEFYKNEPRVLGIFSSERKCKACLKEGECYCAVPLNKEMRENTTPLYIYKLDGKFTTPSLEL